MATYQPAKRATAWVGYISLVDQSDTKKMKSNPTIASGDFKVSKDGGALANLTTLPSVTPASSVMVKIDLSATEMTADNVTVVCIDAAGAEWCDFVFNLQPSARQIDDLAYPATSGRSMVVDANGLVIRYNWAAGYKGAATVDPEARGAIYDELQAYLWQNVVHVPLYNSDFTIAHVAELTGVVALPNFMTFFDKATLA